MTDQPQPTPTSVSVFYSYAHKDEALRKELENHLSLLRREGHISEWHDRQIGPGTEWAPQIDEHLETASIILLLISSDFLASDYCYGIEMQRAMKRHEAKEARVIPIILRPVDWKDAPFATLQALPTDGKPVTDVKYWSTPDHAFSEVAKGIRQVVHELRMLDEARSYVTSHRYEEALGIYDKVLQLYPHSTAAYVGKGDTLSYLKRHQEAVEAYDHAAQKAVVTPIPGTTLFTYNKHSGYALAVAWSPNGKQVVSGGRDGTVRIWDVSSHQKLCFRGHSAQVNGVAWSPDGQLIASASHDGTVQVWEAHSGKLIRRYEGHPSAVSVVAWSPNGQLIASAGGSTVHLWEATSGMIVRRYRGHLGGVYAIAWSPDGQLIASASGDGTIQVWDTTLGVPVHRREIKTAVKAIVWVPNGLLVASDDWQGSVEVWEAKTGTVAQQNVAPGPTEHYHETVTAVAGSPDGQLVASVLAVKDFGSDNYLDLVQIWELSSGKLVQSFTGHTSRVHAIVWSPDGQLIASVTADGSIQIWEALSDTLMQRFTGHTDRIRAIAWSPDGRLVASCGERRSAPVQVWEARSGRSVRLYKDYQYDGSNLAWSPDGQLIALVDWSGIQVWEATSGSSIPRFGSFGLESHVRAVAWSPDGQLLAAALADRYRERGDKIKAGQVELWEARSGNRLLRYEGHSMGVNAVAWSPDGHYLASGGDDKTIQIWNSASGKLVRRFEGYSDEIQAIAWSPDSRQIAWASTPLNWSADSDSSVQVCEAKSGKHLLSYEGHSKGVNTIAWSPDGRFIASGGRDTTVQVWEATSGNLIVNYVGHWTSVNAVAWSPDGEHIASAAHEVHIWQAPLSLVGSN